MGKLNGNNWRFYAMLDGNNYPIGYCETSSELTTTTDVINKTSKGAGKVRRYLAGKTVTTATVSGVCALAVPYSIPKLRIDMQQKGVLLTCTFTAEDDAGNTQNYGGKAIIQSITETGGLDAPVTYTVQLQFDGALTINYDPFNPTPGGGDDMNVLSFDLVAGQGSVTSGDLIGKNAIMAFFDGVYYRIISGPPSAGNLYAQFIPETGSVNLPVVAGDAGGPLDIFYKNA